MHGNTLKKESEREIEKSGINKYNGVFLIVVQQLTPKQCILELQDTNEKI